MKKRKIVIGISSPKQSLKETLRACREAEGGIISEPVYHLNFTDQSTLFSVLSPRRMELLRYLRQNGPLSERQLAKRLGSDYKNVSVDLTLLAQLELVRLNKEQNYSVPWDNITIELTLAA